MVVQIDEEVKVLNPEIPITKKRIDYRNNKEAK